MRELASENVEPFMDEEDVLIACPLPLPSTSIGLRVSSELRGDMMSTGWDRAYGVEPGVAD